MCIMQLFIGALFKTSCSSQASDHVHTVLCGIGENVIAQNGC